ncbi:MAG: SpoIIE family protein phosphatase [Candidatus Eiseniibacteriota bacterium]
MPGTAVGSPKAEELARKLELALRRVASLEALLRAGDLLDPSLEPSHRARLALGLCLSVLPADAACLVTRDGGRESAEYLLRGESALRTMSSNRSRLAHDVLETGREGIRRDPESAGALAAASLLGGPPAVRVGVPLRRLSRMLGALEVVYREDPGVRLDEDLAVLRTVANHLSIVLDNARLVRDRERRARETSHLYDIGTKISAHLDQETLLAAILDALVELVPADAAGIFLIDEETREIRKETLRGYDAARLADVRLKVGRGILGAVAESGKGEIVPDVSRDPRYVDARSGTRSEMAAPLRYGKRVIGVFDVESDRVDAYRPSDLDLLVSFANHAAISIVNARLHAEAKEKRHLDEQLEVARDIQRALLPRSAPLVPGHSLAGSNQPSSAVGGDYFDFLPLSGGRWAVIVADVSGHGVPAALIMAGFRAEVRAGLRREDDPCRVLAEVNRILCGELEPERFVTAFLGVYSPDSGTLVYSNAGHEPGLLVRRAGGVEHLSEGGLLLGVFPDADYRKAMVHLGRGDRLLLYTDGLSEAGDPWGGVLGETGMLRLLQDLETQRIDAWELPERLLDRAESEAPVPPDEADDRTLVVLSRNAE